MRGLDFQSEGTSILLHGSGHVFSDAILAEELGFLRRPESAVLTYILYP